MHLKVPHAWRVSQEIKEELLDCQAENNRLATQTLGSIRVVRSCGAERYEAGVYGRVLDQMRDLKTRKGCYSATFLLLRRVRRVAGRRGGSIKNTPLSGPSEGHHRKDNLFYQPPFCILFEGLHCYNKFESCYKSSY